MALERERRQTTKCPRQRKRQLPLEQALRPAAVRASLRKSAVRRAKPISGAFSAAAKSLLSTRRKRTGRAASWRAGDLCMRPRRAVSVTSGEGRAGSRLSVARRVHAAHRGSSASVCSSTMDRLARSPWTSGWRRPRASPRRCGARGPATCGRRRCPRARIGCGRPAAHWRLQHKSCTSAQRARAPPYCSARRVALLPHGAHRRAFSAEQHARGHARRGRRAHALVRGDGRRAEASVVRAARRRRARRGLRHSAASGWSCPSLAAPHPR